MIGKRLLPYLLLAVETHSFTFTGKLRKSGIRSDVLTRDSNMYVLSKNQAEDENIPSALQTTKSAEDVETKKYNEPWWKSLQIKNNKPLLSVALSIIVFALVILTPLQDALAAPSGGRMGGSFSRQRSSSYSPSMSRSYSRPSVNVYAPRVYTPTPFFNPFFNPFYGYGSPGVIAISRGPSIFDLVVFGGILYAVSSFFMSSSSSLSSGTFTDSSVLGPGFSVVQLSVALNVPNRDSPSSILSKLDSLADRARTSTRVGVQELLAEVSLELMRQKDSAIAASSSYKHYNNLDKATRDYNNIAVMERSKFERETINKYQGVDYSTRTTSLPQTSSKATVAVVTLVFCIEGDSTKIPTQISSPYDLQKALSRISSDARVESCLQGAEILWTPQDRSESLSMRDVLADYPSLRSI